MRFNISFIILKIHIRFIPCKLLCRHKAIPVTSYKQKAAWGPMIIPSCSCSALYLLCDPLNLCGLGLLMPFLPLLLINKVAGDSYEYHSA